MPTYERRPTNEQQPHNTYPSRLDGPDRPATKAVLPASMNFAFHRPIDCSETLPFRAASAIEISPAKIADTILIFFSGIVGGRPIASPPDHTPIMPSQPACQKV